MKQLNEPTKWATEFSPGQAERSEAPPWVGSSKSIQARFSGRQNGCELNSVSPAKAGAENLSNSNPRVSLAALATPWAKFFRQLRWLVDAFHCGRLQVRSWLQLLI